MRSFIAQTEEREHAARWECWLEARLRTHGVCERVRLCVHVRVCTCACVHMCVPVCAHMRLLGYEWTGQKHMGTSTAKREAQLLWGVRPETRGVRGAHLNRNVLSGRHRSTQKGGLTPAPLIAFLHGRLTSTPCSPFGSWCQSQRDPHHQEGKAALISRAGRPGAQERWCQRAGGSSILIHPYEDDGPQGREEAEGQGVRGPWWTCSQEELQPGSSHL